jgi:hypothetical protein
VLVVGWGWSTLSLHVHRKLYDLFAWREKVSIGIFLLQENQGGPTRRVIFDGGWLKKLYLCEKKMW